MIKLNLNRNKLKSLDLSVHSYWQWKSLLGIARYWTILSWHQVACLTFSLKRSANIIWNYQGYHNAPLSTGSLELISKFFRCEDAPFLARYWAKIKSNLNRDTATDSWKVGRDYVTYVSAAGKLANGGLIA